MTIVNSSVHPRSSNGFSSAVGSTDDHDDSSLDNTSSNSSISLITSLCITPRPTLKAKRSLVWRYFRLIDEKLCDFECILCSMNRHGSVSVIPPKYRHRTHRHCSHRNHRCTVGVSTETTDGPFKSVLMCCIKLELFIENAHLLAILSLATIQITKNIKIYVYKDIHYF